MPQIVIKEYDLTTAALSASNSFSVVVPGYIASTKSESFFDENGIYKFTSVAEFEENAGKVTAASPATAKAPTLQLLNSDGTTDYDKYYAKFSAQDFFSCLNDGTVYKATEITTTSEQVEGYLVGKLQTNASTAAEPAYRWFKYTKAVADDWYNTKESATTFDAAEAYEVGNYVYYGTTDADRQLYVCIKAKPEGEITGFKFFEYFEATPKFVKILAGGEGNNASTGDVQIGNQIAYKLLSLGYDVYYVLLNTTRAITDSSIWAPLEDKNSYNFRYILGGLLDNTSTVSVDAVNTLMKSLAETRGDCIALLDIAKSIYADKTSSAAVEAIKNNLPAANQYAAIFAPTVIYTSADTGYSNKEFPASFHYLACAANAASKYPEWFAIAGYQRGISGLTIAGTSAKFGAAAANALQPRTNTTTGAAAKAVNLIVNFNDSYYMWGNRTGYPTGLELVASHFLNIRQLCCTLKKVVYSTCQQLMFEPNSDMLWLNFCNTISPTLEKMVANQGIKDYKFEKKETSKKGKLFAAIRIIPIEAVEDFEIGITLEDNFDEPTITIDETL